MKFRNFSNLLCNFQRNFAIFSATLHFSAPSYNFQRNFAFFSATLHCLSATSDFPLFSSLFKQRKILSNCINLSAKLTVASLKNNVHQLHLTLILHHNGEGNYSSSI